MVIEAVNESQMHYNGTAIKLVSVTRRSDRLRICPVRLRKQSRCEEGMAQFLPVPANSETVMLLVICPEPAVTIVC